MSNEIYKSNLVEAIKYSHRIVYFSFAISLSIYLIGEITRTEPISFMGVQAESLKALSAFSLMHFFLGALLAICLRKMVHNVRLMDRADAIAFRYYPAIFLGNKHIGYAGILVALLFYYKAIYGATDSHAATFIMFPIFSCSYIAAFVEVKALNS